MRRCSKGAAPCRRFNPNFPFPPVFPRYLARTMPPYISRIRLQDHPFSTCRRKGNRIVWIGAARSQHAGRWPKRACVAGVADRVDLEDEDLDILGGEPHLAALHQLQLQQQQSHQVAERKHLSGHWQGGSEGGWAQAAAAEALPAASGQVCTRLKPELGAEPTTPCRRSSASTVASVLPLIPRSL